MHWRQFDIAMPFLCRKMGNGGGAIRSKGICQGSVGKVVSWQRCLKGAAFVVHSASVMTGTPDRT